VTAAAWSHGAAGPLLSLFDELTDPSGAWQGSALCAQADPEIFFPDKGESPAPAKSVCRRCPVRQDCENDALSRRERYGIWGGTTERRRREIIAGRQKAEAA
jgi:WhiB family transcriptional regulator, redox-sensing transcriptional regulator